MTLQSRHDVIDTVRARYGQGAGQTIPELCCPIDYDSQYLDVLPQEIAEKRGAQREDALPGTSCEPGGSCC